ncbi:MAG TPA: hypothetical protein VGR37_16005 [Longimicrobiaceae bacterium]|nr:hypothetical protein [Longimicrobiaceae bacterium]
MNRFEKWSVWSTTAATFLTGAGFFWAKYLVEARDPWAVVNHPLQPWFLKAHILVAPLMVFAVGMIATRHVWRHFRSGMPHGRRSGILTAATLGPMVLTGYLIQAITHVGWLRAMAISHIVVGTLFVLGMALHQPVVRHMKREARGGGASRRIPAQRRAPRATV